MLTPDTRIHFVGIGGTGLSAIATVLHEQGYAVSGCDQQPGALAQALAARGVPVFTGHDAAHLAQADVVVVTSAAASDHAEIAAARERGMPVLKRADFLGELMQGKQGVAVAGTHGKTTTTGMISQVLVAAGLDPTFIVGGTLRDLGTNARAGRGAAFVIEADEYDRMFLGLRPQIAVVTNVEHDHPDIYPTFADMQAAFAAFAALLPAHGLLVACAEDAVARLLVEARRAQGLPAVLYGFSPAQAEHAAEAVDWRARDVRPNDLGGSDAEIAMGARALGTLRLAVPGRHNVLNALAALVVADSLGVDFARAASALATFHGAERRFEVRGQAGGVTVVDDYGHHPTEIRATLAGARARYPQQALWAVWQPHTFSRTHSLLDAFAAAFGDADHAIVTDIYASRERDTLGMSGGGIVAQMAHPDARHVGDLRAVADYLIEHVAPGDVVIVFSAGDATQVSEWVLEGLRRAESLN